MYNYLNYIPPFQMSKTKIPDKTKLELWVKAGGRCEFPGCNQVLWRDDVTLSKMNASYIAHIISDSPKGPRGHPVLSKQLAKEFSNLMLMCDKHHRLIDREKVDEHPVELLQQYKKQHEKRIEWITSLTPKRKTHVLSFAANIGNRKSVFSFEQICEALLSRNKYPVSNPGIEINLTNNETQDHKKSYWTHAQRELVKQVKEKLEQRYEGEEVNHVSVFGLAPIPLLIQLGASIGDIRSADVYHRHRSIEGGTEGWSWSKRSPTDFLYIIKKPSRKRKQINHVVLNLSLSGTIHDEEINKVMSEKFDTYSLTVKTPNRNLIRTKKQLDLFKHEIGLLLQEVRQVYGKDCTVHIFPAIPNSVAIELGRCLLPKSDPKIHVYDNNKKTNGFKRCLTVK